MATGSVIELSNYLEQKIAQKSAEYAAVSEKLFVANLIFIVSFFIFSCK